MAMALPAVISITRLRLSERGGMTASLELKVVIFSLPLLVALLLSLKFVYS